MSNTPSRPARSSIAHSIVVALLFTLAIHTAHAAVPLQVNHQGRVSVAGVIFDGNGVFRFALVDPDTGNNAWTNDGTRVGSTQMPDSAVSLPVINGIYNVRLGDTTLPNMTPLSSTVFNDDNLKLRVWFDDGTHGMQQLTPDQPMASAPYAVHASLADNATQAANADTVDGKHSEELVTRDSLPFNLLENGSFEKWTAVASPEPEKWVNSGSVSVARDTSVVRLGSSSVRLLAAASGSLAQTVTTDPLAIRGKSFTFACAVYCSAANCARIAIDDGVNVTFSGYHSGVPGWETLTVTATCAPTASKLEARVVVFAGTGFFDAAQLCRGTTPREYAPRPVDDAALSADDAAAAVVVGEVRLFAGPISAVPAGWMLCDGAAISRTAFSRLFSVIGTSHGNGDGASTFNLPDLRDRFIVGTSQDDGGVAKTSVKGTLTQTGGEHRHTLTIDEMPSHAHGQRVYHWSTTGVTMDVHRGQGTDASSISALSTEPTGGSQPHENCPPFYALTFIIKY